MKTFGYFASILVLMFSCLISAAGGAAADESTWEAIRTSKVMRIGAVPFEPWYQKETVASDKPGAVQSEGGAWRGTMPRLAERLAKDMGVKLVIVETTWANAVAALQANQIDVMLMLDPTPVRALAVDFIYPVLWNPYGLLVKDGMTGTNWSDFNKPEYKMATLAGTATDELAGRLLPKSTIMRFQTTDEALAAFQSGRVDAYVAGVAASDLIRAKLGRGKTILPKPAAAVPGGAAVRKEVDDRWRRYLQVAIEYYYNSNITTGFYREFLEYRGVDPSTVISVKREDW